MKDQLAPTFEPHCKKSSWGPLWVLEAAEPMPRYPERALVYLTEQLFGQIRTLELRQCGQDACVNRTGAVCADCQCDFAYSREGGAA
jgi:hypothetical protein